MGAIAGYKGDIYIIDQSVSFSAAFTNEATTESGVTRQYTIDDTAKKYWDRNYGITVAGYWAFQEFGLSVASGDSSGLSTTTQYYFKVAVDGAAAAEYSITTAADVTYGAIATLINTAITASGMKCEFINGDIRIHSDSVVAASDIVCSAGTSGTSLFGQGNIPAVGSLETMDWANIKIDTVNFGTSGVKYATGVVQMNYTGFTSLTVTGKYHTLKQAGQFTSYNLTQNCNVVDITDYQDIWKANTGTTRNGSLTLEGIYNNEQYYDLQAQNKVLTKVYLDVGYPAWQEFALSTTSSATSGLSVSTQYYFKVAWDGGGVTEYNITTASDVTWAAIVALMNTAVTASGKVDFVNGDVRISSNTSSFSSAVVCSNGTSGTNLFGSGNVPAVASLQSSYPQGFYVYGTLSNSITITPHEVLRESLSIEVDGILEYFNS